MRRLVPAVMLLIAGCATGPADSGGSAIAPGDGTAESFSSMSQQYIARAGPYSATGASAWVPPAPAPAFVASGPPPPADPPPPDPIAEAISQAADRPEAAAPGASAAPGPALRGAGLALFGNASCGTCHAFADAGASGAIGPSLDRNPRLDKAFAIDVITTGRGAMPSFAGQLSEAEIATLAEYLVAYSAR